MENETDPPAPLEKQTDPLAQFGLDAIDLRWTLKDIAADTIKSRSGFDSIHSLRLIGNLVSVCQRGPTPFGGGDSGNGAPKWTAPHFPALPSRCAMDM